MNRSFSFSEKPVLFILQKFPSLIPGINKVVSIYYDKEFERLRSYVLIKRQDDYFIEESEVNNPGESLHGFRKHSAPFSWIHADDLPFEILPKPVVQLDIFNELNNNVLLLRLLNENDGLSDLFLIYFNNNTSNFGIVDSKKTISTENKTIIGHLLKNAIETLLSGYKEDREIFITLSENNQLVFKELNKTRKELSLASEKKKDGIIQLCKSYLEDLSRECGARLLFSDEAIEKLREYDGESGFLRHILGKAVEYAQSMQLTTASDEIVIYDYHIIIDRSVIKKIPEGTPATEPAGNIPIRYNRTFLFLNKLEAAAQSVKSKNLLLTSLNVGQELPSPVTPAAITDALKNHQSKIISLFKLLPYRWQVIRTEFRPVQNILNPKVERQKRTG